MNLVTRALLLSTLALAATGCQHIEPAPLPIAALAPGDLRSPWDNTPVQAGDAPYNCGPAAPVGPDILITGSLDESHKKNLSEDVKNAVYSVSTRALQDLASRVVSAADTYRATGNLQAARCTAMLLSDAATRLTMTGDITSTEGWNEHNHALRAFTIAYLKIRPSGQVPTEYGKITLWLDGLARRERSHILSFRCENHKCPIHDHAGLNVAIATAVVGIAANDYDLFHWSTSEYKAVVGQIDDRGMLHHDNRGRWAEKWNLESAAALVQIAELAETNNIPLYGYDNGRIHFLVHTVALGLIDATPYRQATKTTQRTESPIPAWEVVWASVYNRRFPDPILTGLLHQIGPTPVDMWGGAPWAPEDES